MEQDTLLEEKHVGQGISISGIGDIQSIVNNLGRTISELGVLPDNIREILLDIRNRVETTIKDVSLSVEGAVNNIRDRVNEILSSVLTRIDSLLDKVSHEVEQVSTVISSIASSLSSVGSLLPSLSGIVPKVISTVKNIPLFIVVGAIIFLLVIALGILIYLWVMEGANRLGISRLLVIGMFLVVVVVALVFLSLFLRSKWKNQA